MTQTPPQPEPGVSPPSDPSPWMRRGQAAFNAAKFLAVLYCFLLSITLVGSALLAFGGDVAEALIRATGNPLVGLFIGILATSIVQSSSATTSIVVGTAVAVGPELLPQFLRNAIPIVMGANIGTTVTAVLVSLGHIRRKEEFRRAFGGALVHEFFKLFTVAVLLPLELVTHYLERTACALCGLLWDPNSCEAGAYAFRSPLKAILQPVAGAIIGLFKDPDEARMSVAAVVFILLVALVLLFSSLWLITKLMRRALVGRAETLIDRTIGRAPLLGLLVGLVLTAVVQSSSAVTSLLVPLAAAGILTLDQIFPIELGSCLGTTVTAMLASLAVGPAGLAVALTHVLFNLTGIVLVYPVPSVRALPVRLARWFAGVAAESKRYAFAYVFGTFFVVPGLLILLARAFAKS